MEPSNIEIISNMDEFFPSKTDFFLKFGRHRWQKRFIQLESSNCPQLFLFHLRLFHLTDILNESWSHEEIHQDKETFSLEMN